MFGAPPVHPTSMDPEKLAKLESNLGLLYGAEAPGLLARTRALLERWAGRIPPRPAGWSERDTFLITYGDSLQADGEPGLATLRRFLRARAGDRFSLVHVLPFYPSTGDDGFSVADFRAVDGALGDWQDLAKLGEHYRTVFDGVVNHVSKSSEYVRGHLRGDPRYAGFCIEEDEAFDDSQVTRPRTSPLFHAYPGKGGEVRLWTTFSEDQVDLNFSNPEVLLELLDVLLFYAARGASMIRLDAIPYMWKESGTTCVHRPQTHAFIRIVRLVFDLAAPHVILLSETNVPHAENLTYFGERGDEAQIIYNFTLAPLILYGLHSGDAGPLTRWAATLEPPAERCTFLNITSTHDGIGMRPAEGILSPEQQQALTDLAVAHGGAVSYRSKPDGTRSPYELNITYFDAVNDPGDAALDVETKMRRFLVSQAIPMALVGIPAIYIHCLLGSQNDVGGARASGIKRRINRAKLQLAEVETELEAPASLRARVFDGLTRLLEARQSDSAFHPASDNDVLDLGRHIFAVLRHNRETGARVLALHNLSGDDCACAVPADFPIGEARDLLDPAADLRPPHVVLPAYGVRWLAVPG